MAKKSKDTIAFGKLIEELQKRSKQTAPAIEHGGSDVSVEPDKSAIRIQRDQLDVLSESVSIEQKQQESLKDLNSQLEKIERALLGMNKKLEKLPKELSNIGPKFSGLKVKESDKTARENLSELVGEFKGLFGSVGKGIKSAFEFIKNPISGTKSGIKKAGTFVADVVGAEAGYTAESDRFATERIKQENAKRQNSRKGKLSEQEEEDLRKSSRQKFRNITTKERELGKVEEKIKESKSYGFNPTKEDIEEKNQAILEIRQQKREAGIPDFAPVEKPVKQGSGKNAGITTRTTPDNSSSELLKVSNKSLQELSLIRKLTEGSLEYDKEAAQYRNTSGREVTSKVTGKDIKKGGFVDFETATDQLSGQSKRVREAAARQEPEVELKSTSSSPPATTSIVEAKGVEADNIQTPQEILADTSKADLEVTKESNQIFKDQLVELKLIRQALTGVDSDTTAKKPSTGGSKVSEQPEEGSSGLLDVAGALSSVGGIAKKAGSVITKGAKAVGAGALSAGKGIARFAGTGAGKALGAAAAVGMGAYTAYSGYTVAEDSKQAKLDEVQAKVDSGELTSEQAAEQRKEIGNTATVEKSSAIGEGTGMATGAIAGAKTGAAIGTFFGGPIGTGIGALAGGALGAFAGSKAGKVVGEYGGKAINSVRGFFGDKKTIPDTVDTATSTTPVSGEKTRTLTNDEVVAAKKSLREGNGVVSVPRQPGTGVTVNKESTDNADLNREKTRTLTNDEVVAAKKSLREGNGVVSVSRQPSTGTTVNKESTDNADLNREITRAPTIQPVVSNNVNNTNTTSYVPVKPSPRPGSSGSALERYTMGVSVF